MGRTVWIMSLGDRDPKRSPEFASDCGPWNSRASVVVDDFAQLFPVLMGWRDHFDPEVVSFAISVPGDTSGQPIPGWERAWEEEGPPYRLCVLPGGFIRVSDYSEALPAGRPLGAAEVGSPGPKGAVDR